MKNILIIISQHNRSEHKYYTCKMDIIRRRGGGGLHCGKTTYITVSTYHGISQTSHVYADHPTRHASPMCTHDNYSTLVTSIVAWKSPLHVGLRRAEMPFSKIRQRESDVVGTLFDARWTQRWTSLLVWIGRTHVGLRD